jgi:hypothetical protein
MFTKATRIDMVVPPGADYQALMEWREPLLQWCSDQPMFGHYKTSLDDWGQGVIQAFWFSDVRDAVLFKARWAGYKVEKSDE